MGRGNPKEHVIPSSWQVPIAEKVGPSEHRVPQGHDNRVVLVPVVG